jgi:hypothetical protein
MIIPIDRETIIEITKKELRDRQNIGQFTCESCGKLSTNSLARLVIAPVEERCLCHTCKIAKRKLERYGDPNYCNVDKIRETTRKNYGVDNISQLESVKLQKETKSLMKFGETQQEHRSRMAKQRMLELYGDEQYALRRMRETLLEKHGVDNPQKIPEVRAKTKATLIANQGGEMMASLEWKQKAIESSIKKFGSIYQKTEEFKKFQREQMKSGKARIITQIAIDKYGCPYPNTPEGRRKSRRKYEYDGNRFDSSWELAYWVYCKDHGKRICFNEITFELEDGSHFTPDFNVDGSLVEIKGDHFLKVNYPSQRIQLKLKCCKENNIVIIIWKDVKEAVSYTKSTYGKNFFEQCKSKY